MWPGTSSLRTVEGTVSCGTEAPLVSVSVKNRSHGIRTWKMYSSLWPAFLRPCKSCKEKWPFSHPFHHCLPSSWYQFHLQKVSVHTHPFLGSQIFSSHCFPCMLLLMAETQKIIMIFKNFPFFLPSQLPHQRTSGNKRQTWPCSIWGIFQRCLKWDTEYLSIWFQG